MKNSSNSAQTCTIAFQLTGDRGNPNVSTYDEVHPTLASNYMSDRAPAICVMRWIGERINKVEGILNGNE
jgi:hypothetical protein